MSWGDGVGGVEGPGVAAALERRGASDERTGRDSRDSREAEWFGASMQRRLAAFARRFVGDDDADDVAQEALIRAGQGISALRRAERAEAWLFRICRHTAIDHVRSRRVRHTVWRPMPDDGSEVPGRLSLSTQRTAPSDLFNELEAGLSHLPAHHRLLMSLHYVKGYSQETICRMTGLSESALRVRLFRARWVLLSVTTGAT